MRSVIVFSDRCPLKNIQVKSEDIDVIRRSDIVSAVSAVCDRIPEEIFNEAGVEAVYKILFSYTQVDMKVKEKHIQNIKNHMASVALAKTENTEDIAERERGSDAVKAERTEEKAEQAVLLCPRCGGELVLRTATRGKNARKQFYGCSGFPKCTYRQDIDQESSGLL